MKRKITITPDYRDHQPLKAFIEGFPQSFEQGGRVLYDKRNVIKSFAIDAADEALNPLVVKRYKYPIFFQRVVYSFFRPTKACRSYSNACLLRQRGIDTPRGVAYIEEWEGALFGYGYFLSANDAAPPIEDRLPDEGPFDTSMAHDFGVFAATLHRQGILHHDLNCTNVLYHPVEGGYRFSVIDINRMKIYPVGQVPTRQECFDNLTKFTKRRDILEAVARSYARARGWDEQTSVDDALRCQERFYSRRRRKKAFLRTVIPGRKE